MYLMKKVIAMQKLLITALRQKREPKMVMIMRNGNTTLLLSRWEETLVN